MEQAKTKLAQFIAEEVAKTKGIAVPIKASPFERALVRHVRWDKCHPNPDDEFSMPEIGPNEQIVSDYVSRLRHAWSRDTSAWAEAWDEPVLVEKIRPDGYMILNGHHRWAAMARMDPLKQHKLLIKILNLTQETDIQKMIRDSVHDKRVSFDLDEVVFCQDPEIPAEHPPRFPFNRVFRERIRRGVPAILHYMKKQGYDVWVYTASYYSMEYIQKLFRHYGVHVDGVITGTARKTGDNKESRKRVEELFSAKYVQTIHIDNASVVYSSRSSKDYGSFELQKDAADWSGEVLEILKKQIIHEA